MLMAEPHRIGGASDGASVEPAGGRDMNLQRVSDEEAACFKAAGQSGIFT